MHFVSDGSPSLSRSSPMAAPSPVAASWVSQPALASANSPGKKSPSKKSPRTGESPRSPASPRSGARLRKSRSLRHSKSKTRLGKSTWKWLGTGRGQSKSHAKSTPLPAISRVEMPAVLERVSPPSPESESAAPGTVSPVSAASSPVAGAESVPSVPLAKTSDEEDFSTVQRLLEASERGPKRDRKESDELEFEPNSVAEPTLTVSSLSQGYREHDRSSRNDPDPRHEATTTPARADSSKPRSSPDELEPFEIEPSLSTDQISPLAPLAEADSGYRPDYVNSADPFKRAEGRVDRDHDADVDAHADAEAEAEKVSRREAVEEGPGAGKSSSVISGGLESDFGGEKKASKKKEKKKIGKKGDEGADEEGVDKWSRSGGSSHSSGWTSWLRSGKRKSRTSTELLGSGGAGEVESVEENERAVAVKGDARSSPKRFATPAEFEEAGERVTPAHGLRHEGSPLAPHAPTPPFRSPMPLSTPMPTTAHDYSASHVGLSPRESGLSFGESGLSLRESGLGPRESGVSPGESVLSPGEPMSLADIGAPNRDGGALVWEGSPGLELDVLAENERTCLLSPAAIQSLRARARAFTLAKGAETLLHRPAVAHSGIFSVSLAAENTPRGEGDEQIFYAREFLIPPSSQTSSHSHTSSHTHAPTHTHTLADVGDVGDEWARGSRREWRVTALSEGCSFYEFEGLDLEAFWDMLRDAEQTAMGALAASFLRSAPEFANLAARVSPWDNESPRGAAAWERAGGAASSLFLTLRTLLCGRLKSKAVSRRVIGADVASAESVFAIDGRLLCRDLTSEAQEICHPADLYRARGRAHVYRPCDARPVVALFLDDALIADVARDLDRDFCGSGFEGVDIETGVGHVGEPHRSPRRSSLTGPGPSEPSRSHLTEVVSQASPRGGEGSDRRSPTRGRGRSHSGNDGGLPSGGSPSGGSPSGGSPGHERDVEDSEEESEVYASVSEVNVGAAPKKKKKKGLNKILKTSTKLFKPSKSKTSKSSAKSP